MRQAQGRQVVHGGEHEPSHERERDEYRLAGVIFIEDTLERIMMLHVQQVTLRRTEKQIVQLVGDGTKQTELSLEIDLSLALFPRTLTHVPHPLLG